MSNITELHISELPRDDNKNQELLHSKQDFKQVEKDINTNKLKFYNAELSIFDVIQSVSSWATVEFVFRASGGINHAFLLRFNKPVNMNADLGSGIMVNLTGGNGIWNSPFLLRGFYNNGNNIGNVVLSEKSMLVDINIHDLKYYCDDLYQIVTNLKTTNQTNNQHLIDLFQEKKDSWNNRIYWTFKDEKNLSATIKRELMMHWLSSFGELLYKKGFYKSGQDYCHKINTLDEIVYLKKNYSCTLGWDIVYEK